MNKKEKEENVIQIADTVAFEIKHILYQEINEHIFDRSLAEESDDETIGTLLYTPYEDGANLDVFDDCLSSVPYVSNCALFFSPRDGKDFRTNHCMANKSQTTFLRKSFQTFWMNEASDWTKDPQSGRIRL